MNVLLTGSTGFLGHRTLERLVLHPEITQVVGNGRTLKPGATLDHEKLCYRLGDLTDPSFASELVKGADVVIHASAFTSPWGRYSDFHQANVLTQHHLIQAAQEYGVKRYVYISTPSIYFNSRDRLNIRESDPLPARMFNAYASTKRDAELELISSGLPYVILRPRALIGRGDTTILPRMIHAFEAGKLKIIGTGQNKVDLTSVANVVSAIELSMQVGSMGLNEIYNISNGDPVLLWEYIEKTLSLLGHSLGKRNVPYWLVNTLARLMEWKSKMTDYREPVLTCYSVGTLGKSFTMDISKARTKLGYNPTVTTDEALEEFVTWYIRNR